MELQLYKTLWGHNGTFEQACQQAVAAGFDGIEGPAPLTDAECKQWRQQLDHYQLYYIAEICTAGSYVPDRHASLQTHLQSLEQKLQAAVMLSPRFVTCIGGCDAWEESLSVVFFQSAITIAKKYGVAISFETHRGRSLFNPWITQRICAQLSDINLTCDFSHWCVVCERLLESEETTLSAIFPHAFHIHARVGYDQGPQVPDPRAARYRHALDRHQFWWWQIWREKMHNNAHVVTMTPEFGPDGYQAVTVDTDQPVGDLWQFNGWIAQQQRKQFALFSQSVYNTAPQEVKQ